MSGGILFGRKELIMGKNGNGALRLLFLPAFLAVAALGLGFTAGNLGPSAVPPAPLVLAYLANEGVLISSGTHKVLIDAIFNRPHPDYRAPSSEVLEQMLAGTPPFDGVDLLLVTHNHPDHFAAPLAAKYMAASAGTILVAPADAVADLRKAAEWAKIEARVVSLDLKIGERAAPDPKGIPLAAFRTLHSSNVESPMNLLFLFELDGWRVFHEGDSRGKPEDYRGFGLELQPIDLALVHYWFPLDPVASIYLQKDLKLEHIALMHLPLQLESDAPGKIDQVRKYYKDIFLLLPGMAPREFRK
jgi:L-ascorbate metabolism protein UlaG (beta-lactamase superfamily)